MNSRRTLVALGLPTLLLWGTAARADSVDDAGAKVFELSLHTGDYSPVEAYLQKLSQLPAGEQLPSVPYVQGKYRYFRKQYPEAIAVLRALPLGHKYFLYGQYFIGAANVAMGPEHFQ